MRAVVVGAGVGGLCTSIGLARAGWDVVVLERWPGIVGVGAGLGVWPDAQHTLDELGLGPAFRAAAIDFGPTSLFTAEGRRLCAVPGRRIERRGGAPVRILTRTALIDLLAAEARAGCDIRTGTAAADHPDLLAAADLVVGADGLRSTVRAQLFADAARPVSTGYLGWRGRLPVELDPGEYGERWGDRCLVGLTRLEPGATNFYVAAPDTVDRFPRVLERLARWASPVPDLLGGVDPDRVLRQPIEELRPHLRRYVVGRAALLGDAAHAMTPNLGRGACEAILDAGELVARVGAVDRAGVPAALREYDRARRRRTQRAVDRSRRMLSVATARRTAVRNGVLRLAAGVVT